MNPTEYATAIGRAIDQGDAGTAHELIGRFATEHPAAYGIFLPVFQAEVLRRKQ